MEPAEYIEVMEGEGEATWEFNRVCGVHMSRTSRPDQKQLSIEFIRSKSIPYRNSATAYYPSKRNSVQLPLKTSNRRSGSFCRRHGIGIALGLMALLLLCGVSLILYRFICWQKPGLCVKEEPSYSLEEIARQLQDQRLLDHHYEETTPTAPYY